MRCCRCASSSAPRFLYAGLDKLILDRGFFDPNSPTSIQAQFTIFERVSPLAPLVRLAEPYAVILGVLIALGEIGAGLGCRWYWVPGVPKVGLVGEPFYGLASRYR